MREKKHVITIPVEQDFYYPDVGEKIYSFQLDGFNGNTKRLVDLIASERWHKREWAVLNNRFLAGPRVEVAQRRSYEITTGTDEWYWAFNTHRADRWEIEDRGDLTVYLGEKQVAAYPAGGWIAVRRADIEEETEEVKG